MRVANIDQSRLVQQTICYNRQLSWSFSLSWGYSLHVYKKVIPRSILKVSLETFKSWFWGAKPPLFIFNTRPVSHDPCAAPHVFSFKSAKKINENEVLTNYVCVAPRGLLTCLLGGNHSEDLVSRIEVVSPVTKPNQVSLLIKFNYNYNFRQYMFFIITNFIFRLIYHRTEKLNVATWLRPKT